MLKRAASRFTFHEEPDEKHQQITVLPLGRNSLESDCQKR